MDRMQVRSLKIDVLPRHLHRSVPKDFHRVELEAAPSDVVRRECMAQSMDGSFRRFEAQVAAQLLYVPQCISPSEFCRLATRTEVRTTGSE